MLWWHRLEISIYHLPLIILNLITTRRRSGKGVTPVGNGKVAGVGEGEGEGAKLPAHLVGTLFLH